jgi:hypothetical protein
VGEVGIVRRIRSVKLHLICSTNRVPISYELSEANVADVLLVRELLAGAGLDESVVARRLLGDLAYSGAELGDELAEAGVLCWPPRRRTVAHQCASRWRYASLPSSASSGWSARSGQDAHWVGDQDLKAKVAAYTYGLYINRLLGRPQGRIKELWA